MARFDMFSWLMEKKREASAPPSEPETSDAPEYHSSSPATSGAANGIEHHAIDNTLASPAPCQSEIVQTPDEDLDTAAQQSQPETKQFTSSPDATPFQSVAAGLGLDAQTLIAEAAARVLAPEPSPSASEKIPAPAPSLPVVERTPEEIAAAGAITHDELLAKLNASEATPEFSALSSEFIIPFESAPSQGARSENVAARVRKIAPTAPTIGFDAAAASLGLDAPKLRADAAEREQEPAVEPDGGDPDNTVSSLQQDVDGSLGLEASPPSSNAAEIYHEIEIDGAPMMPINEHQHVLKALTEGRREPKPVVGMPALELSPPRLRQARVTGVKAGGHRVTALILDANRSYTYALQKDGTYRLEGGTPKTAPRLLLNLEV